MAENKKTMQDEFDRHPAISKMMLAFIDDIRLEKKINFAQWIIISILSITVLLHSILLVTLQKELNTTRKSMYQWNESSYQSTNAN